MALSRVGALEALPSARVHRFNGAAPALLVLDDWGKERRSEWSVSMLWTLLDARYRRQAPTLVTTNLSTREFGAWVGQAAASRIGEAGTWATLRDRDYRLGGQK
jgi:DNA replication protein DnaC